MYTSAASCIAGDTLLSKEGITQEDPLAIATYMYALKLATLPLINHYYVMSSKCGILMILVAPLLNCINGGSGSVNLDQAINTLLVPERPVC